MKRRSLQSLRTPSPFTAAEQWYTAAKGYGEGGLSADAGVAHPPWKHEPEDPKAIDIGADSEVLGHEAHTQEYAYPASDVTSVYEDVSEERHSTDRHARPQKPDIAGIEEKDTELAEKEDQNEADEDDYNDEIVNREEADDYESDASSYHDSVTTAISHEDREDAFDYEHFFLHSAMGTISQQRNGRRGSVGSFSSEDSVETTRGPVAQDPERPNLTHLRTGSSASVSTVASFATATEGRRSEDLQDEDRENFAVQEVDAPEQRSSTPVTAKRETFGGASPMKNGYTIDRQPTPEETERPSSVIHDKSERDGTNQHRPSIGSFESYSSTGSTRSFPLVNKPKPRQTLTPPGPRENEGSILSDSMTLIDRQSTASGDRLQPSPVHMLARDDQILVERLVASLGKCVLGLQESGRASYDGRVWRRRLDAARRVLEGQEGAI
jgi:hypothetical protein